MDVNKYQFITLCTVKEVLGENDDGLVLMKPNEEGRCTQ